MYYLNMILLKHNLDINKKKHLNVKFSLINLRTIIIPIPFTDDHQIK